VLFDRQAATLWSVAARASPPPVMSKIRRRLGAAGVPARPPGGIAAVMGTRSTLTSEFRASRRISRSPRQSAPNDGTESRRETPSMAHRSASMCAVPEQNEASGQTRMTPSNSRQRVDDRRLLANGGRLVSRRSTIRNLRTVDSAAVTVPQRSEIHATLQAPVCHRPRRRHVPATLQSAVRPAELTHGRTTSHAHVPQRDLVHRLHAAHRSHVEPSSVAPTPDGVPKPPPLLGGNHGWSA
jgi:hypothetical protein